MVPKNPPWSTSPVQWIPPWIPGAPRDVAIGSAGRARLDLTGAQAHGQVSDGRVLAPGG